MTYSVSYSSKFEALHRFWWYIHMNEQFSIGRKKTQPTKQKYPFEYELSIILTFLGLFWRDD